MLHLPSRVRQIEASREKENGHGMPLHRHTMATMSLEQPQAVPPSQSVVLLHIDHELGCL